MSGAGTYSVCICSLLIWSPLGGAASVVWCTSEVTLCFIFSCLELWRVHCAGRANAPHCSAAVLTQLLCPPLPQVVPESLANIAPRVPRSQESIAAQQRAKVHLQPPKPPTLVPGRCHAVFHECESGLLRLQCSNGRLSLGILSGVSPGSCHDGAGAACERNPDAGLTGGRASRLAPAWGPL